MDPRAPSGPAAVFQMMDAAQTTGVLVAAVKLDVFSKLGDEARDVAHVAAAIGAPERSTRILLEAMVVHGMLEKEQSSGRYRLTPLSRAHLVPGRPGYVGDLAGIKGASWMWAGLSRLAEAVKKGGTVLEDYAERAENFHWEGFARSSGSTAFAVSAALLPLIRPRIKGRPTFRVLDVACGSGLYGYSVLLDHPNVEATLLDWPNVLPEARKWGERLRVDPKRVRTIEGNLFEADFQGPYDLVLLSHVYHHFEPPTCERLSRKVAAALAPGGAAVVHDFLSDGGDRAGAMFAVVMLLWTHQGTTYGSEDYARWLSGAGLKSPSVHHPPGLPTGFVIAEK